MACTHGVDMSEPERFRGPANLEELAISLGRYDPAVRAAADSQLGLR